MPYKDAYEVLSNVGSQQISRDTFTSLIKDFEAEYLKSEKFYEKRDRHRVPLQYINEFRRRVGDYISSIYGRSEMRYSENQTSTYVSNKITEIWRADRQLKSLYDTVQAFCNASHRDFNTIAVHVAECRAMNKLYDYLSYVIDEKPKSLPRRSQPSIIKPSALHDIGHEFIVQQIAKCQQKIDSKDYNGAITNARTLTEAILIHVIEKIENIKIINDGNILNLWSKTKKALKIRPDKETYPDFVFQILTGLNTSLNGLAALSNNASDRHANDFNTKEHHAKLAVNIAMTLSDFLLDLLSEQKTDGK